MKKIFFLLILSVALVGCNTNETKKTTESVTTEEKAISDINSIDNRGYGWGFKKEQGKKPDIPKETEDILEKYDAFYIDKSGEKVMFLTFDEGYEAGYTAQILDTLKDNGVKAAFFITGDYFDREQDLVKRMHDEGHIIGNHTEHHPNLHKLGDYKKMQEELKILDDKYFSLFGEHMEYMRPPEGEYSERVLASAKDLGYKTAFWSFAYRDWLRDDVKGKEYAKESVIPYFHDGAVLLLHAVSKDNAEALGDIIDEAKKQGFSFKNLDSIKPKEDNQVNK